MTRRVYLYAFDEVFKIVNCMFLEGDSISVRNMQWCTNLMMYETPDIRMVCAVDNRSGLYAEYREACTSSDFSKHVEFADTVTREGILIR